MKNNRKNRKLNFIRTKNQLRSGKNKFYCTEKVSNLLKEELTQTESYWEKLINTAKKSLLKIYKLELRNVEIITGTDGDDFIKNLHTNRVCLFNQL